MPKSRILVIDDEAAIRDSLRMTLEYAGYEFLGAATGQEGLALAERESPDVVLLDIKMPGMDGMDVLTRLRSMNETTPVVMISGHGTTSTAVEAIKRGAADFLDKPFESTDRLLVTISNALEKGRLRDENRSLKKQAEIRHQMIGDSAGLAQVMAAVSRAAPTNATVLIHGESGVGKELVARTIHRNSNRSRERFVQVNCAAIPEELIESELFGHEKGSFTGAVRKQTGKFVAADGGTIFLDEIGDMSARTQAKVLRVLQNGEVEPVGAERTVQVDVRVVAATNRNLEDEIAAGRFREDLYYRLNVIPVRTPALREHLEDLPLLVDSFTRRYSEANNCRPKELAPDALAHLRALPWKGNVRELKNLVERLLILSPGETVTREDVIGATGGARPELSSGVLAVKTLREFRDVSERMFLIHKLEENNWNVTQTAQSIDTPR
ncbi:MAG TPA: sigma-54 dependent transcriptional regulator, partial [Thermoanaerobaculia bacterium]|nr:sigma-54 dependent transcriptional regulator [Thermoanaerobaculia bacterium]